MFIVINRICKTLLLVLCMLVATHSFAQFGSLPENLSNYKSSMISNEQMNQAAIRIKQEKLDVEQVYKLLEERNMPQAEINDIRARLTKALQEVGDNPASTKPASSGSSAKKQNSESRMPELDKEEKKEIKNPKKIYGLEIFNNGVLSFEPNLKIATPANYVLGADDEINISIYGYQEAKYNLTVSPEGDITMPFAGVIQVAGLTIEQATEKIKSKLASKGYSNIKTGLTKVKVSVGKIRSIRVTILGEVERPGGYTLPSLATAFNALYLSGGPNEIGSMRLIEIVRNNKMIAQLDIYDFLLKGNNKEGNIILQDNDVIRVPAYKTRVSVEGEVKRPGLYEMKDNETLQQLLTFTGGFSDSAYTANIQSVKLTDTEKRITDVAKSDFNTYVPSRSESFVVRKMIDRYTNRVKVGGAVYLAGEYELTQGMTVKQLLQKAQGLKPEAFADRAVIHRLKDDLTTEVISFQPKAVSDGTVPDLVLKNNDSVHIVSQTDLKGKFLISINGEIRRPGQYYYSENMSLKDLLLMAGGFSDAAAAKRIEIGRRLRNRDGDTATTQVAEVIDIHTIDDLSLSNNTDIKLMPWDIIMVRRNPAYKDQVSIKIDGEVLYPGGYILQNKTDRISNAIKRAGGITAQAYAKAAYLVRANNKSLIDKLTNERAKLVQDEIKKDSLQKDSKDTQRPYDQIALKLDEILSNPGGSEDIFLQEGDVIVIPKERSEVRISGGVLFPTQVPFKSNKDLDYYMNQAGGYTDDARKGKVYVVYPNGSAAKTKRFLFFKNYPEVLPGSEIVIPRKSDYKKQKLSTGEIIGISTAFASMAGVLVALINSFK